MRFSPLLFILFLFIACTNSTTEQTTPMEKAPQQAAPESPPPSGPVVREDAHLSSITIPELQNMWNICNQIDYVFYDLPISSSVNDQPSAQAHLRHISDTPISHAEKAQCQKAIGRIFYKTNGEDLIESEAFFGPKCAFFIFYKKGKAVYSNKMTPAGVEYFNQIIAAANGAKIGG